MAASKFQKYEHSVIDAAVRLLALTAVDLAYSARGLIDPSLRPVWFCSGRLSAVI